MIPMPDASPTVGAGEPRLLSLTDQCVMCGLCIPHCPTYHLEPVEAESPRGRIALARALATGSIEPTPRALDHLDHCLGCLSCQKVCPSNVDYEQILVRSRALLIDVPRPAHSRLPRLLRTLLRDPIRLTALARLATRLQAGRWLPGLARWFPAGSAWRRIASAQPASPPRLRLASPAEPFVSTRGRVALFRGCVASVHDRDTQAAATRLLQALGYEVVEATGTHCCGALARHHGAVESAAHTAAATRKALLATGADTVLVTASGCFADLRDEVAAGTALRVVDAQAFIAAAPGSGALRFRPLRQRAALHLPCTQVNVVGATTDIRALLQRIPELELTTLPEQPRCCGAAGSYFLEQPALADRLRNEKLDQAERLQPDVLLTTNIGCRLHLGNGLRDRGSRVVVRHPLTLLAEQLDPAPGTSVAAPDR